MYSAAGDCDPTSALNGLVPVHSALLRLVRSGAFPLSPKQKARPMKDEGFESHHSLVAPMSLGDSG